VLRKNKDSVYKPYGDVSSGVEIFLNILRLLRFMEPKELLEARVLGEYDKDMFKAIALLRQTGFKVCSTAASGLAEPELNYNGSTYSGLEAIKNFVEQYKKQEEYVEQKILQDSTH